MAESYDDRLERHEAQIEELRGIARQQAAWNEQQMVFNQELIALHHTVDARLERLEQLLERLLRGSGNGRDPEVTP